MPAIERTQHGSVTVLRMTHGRANAMDVELMTALQDALVELRQAPAVVLTGTGTIFSAGVDLFKVAGGGGAYLESFMPVLRSAFQAIFDFPRPLVAAVNGHAIAGGCVLVAAADHRVMSEGVGTIGVTELRVGVPFPVVALEIMRFGTGGRDLGRLVMTAQAFGTVAALELGLIDELSTPEATLDRAVAVATQLGTIPARSFEIVKRELRRPYRESIEAHSARVDAEVAEAWRSDQVLAAIRGYVKGI